MSESRAEAIRKIHEFADDNHWKMADYRLLDIRDGKVSFATIYMKWEDGSLWGAIVIDDEIVVNGGTGCKSASEYIVDYFREEVM